MATHSSTLAWKISWMEEPGRLQSMASLGVRHYSVTSLSLFTFMHWRRKWQPTPVFLPGESLGQRSLGGYRPWGHKRVKHNCTTNTITSLSLYNKLINVSQCFSDFCEPFQQINQTEKRRHGNFLFQAKRSETLVTTCAYNWHLKRG